MSEPLKVGQICSAEKFANKAFGRPYTLSDCICRILEARSDDVYKVQFPETSRLHFMEFLHAQWLEPITEEEAALMELAS